MIPPPPPLSLMNTLQEQRKRRKRFVIISTPNKTTNHINNDRKVEQKLADFQVIPFVHYGLDRTGPIVALMDRENCLTHSPTLISFGGNSYEFGYQKSLVMLDLDPATKYTHNGELDPSFEYEWKQIKTVNNDIFDKDSCELFGHVQFPVIYCKLYQCVYILSNNWVARLSLKTLEWKKRSLAIDECLSSYYSYVLGYPKFALPYGDQQFIMCTIKSPCSSEEFSIYNFSDLEQCFNKEEGSNINDEHHINVWLNGVEQLLALQPNRKDIHARMSVPLFPEKKVLFYGSLVYYPENHMFIMDFNERTFTKLSRVVDWPENCCVVEIPNPPEEFYSNSRTVLIATGENYYQFNVGNGLSRMLNPFEEKTIEMKFQRLFSPFMATFKTRKNENQVVHLINNDVLFILRLDYRNPCLAFNYRLNMGSHFSDIIVIQ